MGILLGDCVGLCSYRAVVCCVCFWVVDLIGTVDWLLLIVLCTFIFNLWFCLCFIWLWCSCVFVVLRLCFVWIGYLVYCFLVDVPRLWLWCVF